MVEEALPSSTIENYLKAIYLAAIDRSAEQPLLPMGQLATALGVAPSSATMMAKTLSESGLIVYEPYEGVALTPAGKRLAGSVVRRHRLIELFLVRVMGLGWDEVHDHAERLEHVVVERLIERMDEILGHPEFDPHGDPIPDADGRIKAQTVQSLMTCPVNTPVTVARVADQDGTFLRFIASQKLEPGQSIEVETREPASESVRLRRTDGERITIGARAASKLLVTITSPTIV